MPTKGYDVEARSSADDLSYDDARSAQLERVTTARIVGVPLTDASRISSSMKGIQHCLCVQDSPENPCPCTGPIVWFPKDALVREIPAGRRDDQGRNLTVFIIRRDATLILERPRTIRAGAYAALTQARPRARGRPRMMASVAPGPGAGAQFGAAALGWTIGWTIGKEIDQASGGAVSDAGAEAIEAVVDAATEVWDWVSNW